jgi:membrane-associated phospholipid phosphatase
MAQSTTQESAASGGGRVQPARHSPSRRRRLWWGAIGVVALGLLASAAMLVLLTEAHQEVIEPQTQNVDLTLLNQTHTLASPAVTTVMQTITMLGSAQALSIVVLASALILLLRRAPVEALGLVAAFAGAGLLDALLKLWFHRERPSVQWALAQESTFSFPSGHAMLSLVIYGMILYLILRLSHSFLLSLAAGLIALPLILGIGVSRVYLGVHYPSDILAGYLAGALWLLAVILSLEALHRLFPTRVLAVTEPAHSPRPALAADRSPVGQ